MGTLIWLDIDCVAEIEKENSSISFKVFEIIGRSGEKFDTFEFERKGATQSGDTTSDIKEAQTLLKGLIKWDACSHVTFGDDEGYIHLCGGKSWFNFIEAIKRVWEIAMKELPKEHSKDMFDLELFNK